MGKPFLRPTQLFVIKNFSETHASFMKPLAIGSRVPGSFPSPLFWYLWHRSLSCMELLIILMSWSMWILHFKIIVNGDQINLSH